MVAAASARPMQLMICWHQTAEVWPHVSEKRLDQRRLSVCLMHEMRNDVRCPDVSRNSVQTDLTRLYPFITFEYFWFFDVSWLYMIMIHDFTFAAGCLCVAAFLMSRDESSRIDFQPQYGRPNWRQCMNWSFPAHWALVLPRTPHGLPAMPR